MQDVARGCVVDRLTSRPGYQSLSLIETWTSRRSWWARHDRVLSGVSAGELAVSWCHDTI